MDNKVREDITKLHKFYLDEVRPTTIQCESVIGDLPDNVYIEIRNGFDHISRVEGNQVNEKDVEKVLDLGYEHFKRSVVDAWETMNIVLSDRINELLTSVRISIYKRVDKGNYYNKLYEAQQSAIKMVIDARCIKSDKYDLARKKLQEAFNILDKTLKEFIGTNSIEEYLIKRDKNSNLMWTLGLLASFVFGIAATIITTKVIN